MKVIHIKKFVKKHAFAFLIIPLLGIAIMYYSVNLSNLKALIGIPGTNSITEITINNAARDGDVMNIDNGDCVITFDGVLPIVTDFDCLDSTVVIDVTVLGDDTAI